jgi:hypothetical protein
MLDELCALTGWSRRHARRALAGALHVPVEPVRRPRQRVPHEPLKRLARLGGRRCGVRAMSHLMGDGVPRLDRGLAVRRGLLEPDRSTRQISAGERALILRVEA